MKTKLLTLLFLMSGLIIHAQTLLEKSMTRICVDVNIPSYLIATQNENFISPSQITGENQPPTIAQSDGIKKASVDVYNSIFGLVHSIIKHKEEEYIIFVSVLPGRGESRYDNVKSNEAKVYNLNEIPFTRIRSDLLKGKNRSITSQETYELDKMIIHCPREQAKALFNANAMVKYPIDMKGNVYMEKYTKCIAIAVAKDGLSFYLYFMLTDDGEEKLDTYLEDIKGVFRFHDGEHLTIKPYRIEEPFMPFNEEIQ